MQGRYINFLKITLVTWALFAQHHCVGSSLDNAPTRQTQCCGMRRLRDLFHTSERQTPDSFAVDASSSSNEDT